MVPYSKKKKMAQRELGDPAANMGLRYLEYSISVEESTSFVRGKKVLKVLTFLK